MDFLEELGKAVDPEAFDDEAIDRMGYEEAERLYERRDRITKSIRTALGRMNEEFKVVQLPVPSYSGDYYMIDGYGDGREASLYLNEKRLGSFLVTLLKMGGDLCSLSPMNAEFKDCHVSAIVKLNPARKEELEKATGLTLRPPPTFKPA